MAEEKVQDQEVKKIQETIEIPEGRPPFHFDKDLKKAAEEVTKVIEEENGGN